MLHHFNGCKVAWKFIKLIKFIVLIHDFKRLFKECIHYNLLDFHLRLAFLVSVKDKPYKYKTFCNYYKFPLTRIQTSWAKLLFILLSHQAKSFMGAAKRLCLRENIKFWGTHIKALVKLVAILCCSLCNVWQNKVDKDFIIW